MKKLILLFVLGLMSCESDSEPFTPSSDTQSGSYANMLTIGDNLYVVSSTEITTLDLTEPSKPVEIDRQVLGTGIESLFYFGGQLFIGSREDLFIYDITGNGIPQEVSRTNYNTFLGTCGGDPVVVTEEIAYVTLSTLQTNGCNTISVNELRLYDVRNLEQPILINQINMSQPKGLGLDDNWLFVCDDGLKVLDVTDPLDVTLIHHFDDITTFDVIVQDGLLLVVGPDDLYQFDYSIMSEMKMLSRIEL